MSLYEFKKDDVLINVLKTYPEQNFFIYDSKVYYQNQNAISSSQTENIFGIPTGFISLMELNVDRKQINTGRTIGKVGAPDTNIIYPFLIKDGSGLSFKSVSREEYETITNGNLMTGSYLISASISRKYIPSNTYYNYRNLSEAAITSIQNTIGQTQDKEVVLNKYKTQVGNTIKSELHSLETPLRQYSILSPHFYLSSSYGDKRSQNVNLISIPSIFHGSEIKKGSIKLRYYITGTLVGELSDSKQNGNLIQSSGSISSNDGKVAGVVMYKHGFILLTGSWSLDSNNISYDSTDNSKWIYWGAGCNDGLPSGNSTRVSASYSLQFQGTERIPTMTFFATAPKGDLNWSNNPTFLETGSINFTGSGLVSDSKYVKQQQFTIKNVVSSSILNYSSSFDNVTYINTVNIYDDNGNLIGVAKTSKPIKKTPYNDFTFKLKLDM